MGLTPRYLLRFLVWSVLLFLAYQPLGRWYGSLLAAPLVVLLGPLQALPSDGRVQFEWLEGAHSFRFTRIELAPLGQNVIVLSALILALSWPLRRRLGLLLGGLLLLSLFNTLHLGVILAHDYWRGRGPPAEGVAFIVWSGLRIAYHLGRQVGTMLLPFLILLLFTLRQTDGHHEGRGRGRLNAAKQRSQRSRARGCPPGIG